MTTFQLIILIAYMAVLAWKFVTAIDRDCLRFGFLFGFELVAFAYFANMLM